MTPTLEKKLIGLHFDSDDDITLSVDQFLEVKDGSFYEETKFSKIDCLYKAMNLSINPCVSNFDQQKFGGYGNIFSGQRYKNLAQSGCNGLRGSRVMYTDLRGKNKSSILMLRVFFL